MALTAYEFIAKWGPGGSAYTLTERAGAQPHFIDLCQMLGVPTPADPDRYTFEKGVKKTGSDQGWADVWLKGHFAWEYKAPGKKLDAALRQLMMYALPLESPPLLVVSDRLRIEIHTHFTGTPSECHVILLEDLTKPDAQEKLRWLFEAPTRFKPAKSNQEITEEAASTFASTAERLRAAGTPPEQVSHFLTQCLFCFFAEDVELLPSQLFERLIGVKIAPARMQEQLAQLFRSMRDGGMFGVDDIPWFNGGLFATVNVPKLTAEDIFALRDASALNWSAIDPSIFGTLFERGLDPSKRSQLGAHYTDPKTIARIVDPVVREPLLVEWANVAAEITELLVKRDELRTSAEKVIDKVKFARIRTQANSADRDANRAFNGFLERLKTFKVLDPACGSGNFLFLALKTLKDVEHQVNLEAELLGLQRQQDVTGPHNVLGIEINEYAAELARVTVWIGELQWRIQHGYAFKTNPILEPLDCIEHRDALMKPDGTEAAWPAASVIIGNPPFVGDKKMRSELGIDYTESLRKLFKSRVPGGADFVCYWFEKARYQIEHHGLGAAGLVSTQSIRNGFNVRVLDRVVATAPIFGAWTNEPWVNDGASVRVSITCFGGLISKPVLNGVKVARITADLSDASISGQDATNPLPAPENVDTAFRGITRSGDFTVDGILARQWLASPNVSGKSNADVVRPLLNGNDVTKRPSDTWVVDFGCEMTELQASDYDLPFAYVKEHVYPVRQQDSNDEYRIYWWRFARPRPALRAAIAGLDNFVATLMVSKHRTFSFIPATTVPEQRLIAIARADHATFGILSSRIHSLWALRWGGDHGVANTPVYNVALSFETFPFPAGLTPKDTAGKSLTPTGTGALVPDGMPLGVDAHASTIADAALKLDTLRRRWMHPPEWADSVPDVTPIGMKSSPYPLRHVAKAGFAAQLQERTMTKLYNAMPAWLVNAHADLDVAVAAAYGWADYSASMSDAEVLQRLFTLNIQRASKAVAG